MADLESVQALFDAIRESCSIAMWSRGVELVRADAIHSEGEQDGEIQLRVSTRGGLVCPSVNLRPDDEDWDCDCSSRENVCDHTAGAVIALRRAVKQGRSLDAAKSTAGRIGYRFTRSGGALHFARVIVTDGAEVPLRTTLSAITSGRVEGPSFVATRADTTAESVVAARSGALPRGLLPRLLEAIADATDVRLDGEVVRTSSQPVGLRARVVDADEGFRVFVGRDPEVVETFSDGVALRGDTLCPIGQAGLLGRELESLRRGRYFAPGDAAELVTELLPSLEGRLPIDVQTTRLPGTVRERPRIAVEVGRAGDALTIFPTIVYGSPAVARVDAGRLVSFGAAVPLRDRDAEERLSRRLQNELRLKPGHRIELRGEEAIEVAERLASFGEDVRGTAHEAFFRAPELVPHLRIRGDGFSLDFNSPLDDGEADAGASSPRRGGRRADPAQVMRAWRNHSALVPLIDGGFAPLPTDWLERFGHNVADLLAARDDDGAVPKVLLPDLAKLAAELDQPEPPGFTALRSALGDGDDLPRAELPDDLAAELRSYQRTGVDWLCVLREAGLGALLADDMGLGKTLQALCALRGRTLVVAPTSVLTNWSLETSRFRPRLSTCVYHGPMRTLDADADLTLTTYAILRLDADALAEVAWDTVVLDEAQAIKNPTSQVARAAFRLKADFRLTLTGTPVENRLDELWSQLHFANPGLLGGRSNFDERCSRPIERGEEGAAERLRRRIRPFVLRRLKRDVAPELPPRTEVVLHPALSDEERAVYDAIRAATRRDVVEKLGGNAPVMAVLEALLRLRQAACHSGLIPGQHANASSKVDLLCERLDESVADGHKALVFSQWTSLLDLVEPHLDADHIPFTRLDGSTRDRGAVVERFQDPAGPPVLLASLKAGGVGLNLTEADTVYILDPWWNPAAEDQAADRAHRIGQDKPVTIIRLVTQNTVEERILELQQRKRKLADAALGTSDESARVTREDLLALLE